MKQCKHDWSIAYRTKVDGVDSTHMCSKCGKFGRAVLRYNPKIGKDEWTLRKISHRSSK